MKILETICEKSPQGVVVKSPAVGYLHKLPMENQILSSHAPIGRLQILGTTYSLHLPPNLQGKVAGVEADRLIKPVAYEEPLFTLTPLEAQASLEVEQNHAATVGQNAGKIVVASPTDGIFYRRPAPDAPAYVEVGAVVRSGQVLGLVEVMKCFSQIIFTGAGLPEAKVLEIGAVDGAEVKYQQTLFVLG